MIVANTIRPAYDVRRFGSTLGATLPGNGQADSVQCGPDALPGVVRTPKPWSNRTRFCEELRLRHKHVDIYSVMCFRLFCYIDIICFFYECVYTCSCTCIFCCICLHLSLHVLFKQFSVFCNCEHGFSYALARPGMSTIPAG